MTSNIMLEPPVGKPKQLQRNEEKTNTIEVENLFKTTEKDYCSHKDAKMLVIISYYFILMNSLSQDKVLATNV